MGGTTGISQPPNASAAVSRCRVSIRYGTTTAQARPATVPTIHNTQSMPTASGSPMMSLPSSRVPAPTVSIAIGGAP